MTREQSTFSFGLRDFEAFHKIGALMGVNACKPYQFIEVPLHLADGIRVVEDKIHAAHGEGVRIKSWTAS
jgi:hypothetical protein